MLISWDIGSPIAGGCKINQRDADIGSLLSPLNRPRQRAARALFMS
jgi:hypothetical protein